MKRLIRGISVTLAEEAAQAALRAPNASTARKELHSRLRAAIGDLPNLTDGLPE